MAFDGEAFAAQLRAKGIPCVVKPKRTEEQKSAALEVIKKHNQLRGVHNQHIGITTNRQLAK